MKPCFIFRDKTLFYLKIKAIAFIRDKGHRFYLGKQSSALFRDKGLMIQKELSVGLSAERIGFWRINSQHCYRKFCNGFFFACFFLTEIIVTHKIHSDKPLFYVFCLN